eukprot:TRINITY_DN2720_c0_g1_i1.p1 TRINITY_DN2720_c0_g1~~TRINITY_DN2720_c0_g1_i1.p1  ORF type:complete len:331 (-),score=30.27 TRINITY_DN2720_c0_g1_i1:77-979(-)
MFQVEDSYLSGAAEIIRIYWSGQPFEKEVNLSGVDLTIKRTQKFMEQDFNSVGLLSIIQNKYSTNIYCVQLKNTATTIVQTGVQWTFLQDAGTDNKNYLDFAKSCCENIDGNNYLTFYLWKKGDPTEEQRFLELTDGYIKTENTTFFVNIAVLAKSSQIIYNMIKDLELSYNPKNRVDFSTLFEGASDIHIQMYLSFCYNQNFMFQLLSDILGVLQIAVKLDNQILIDRIMNLEDLGRIVKSQLQTKVSSSSSLCYVHNVLEFAMKHKMHNLILFCELVYLRHKDKNPTAIMKSLFKHFN